MNNQNIINFFQKKKIVAILRGIYDDDLHSLVKALSKGGVKLIEVTFDQKNPEDWEKTAESIKYISEKFKNDVIPGAGTVISKEQIDMAKKSGAKYIISPNTDKEVIAYTKELNLISIPGASTATEIMQAHSYGADFVKLFPAGTLGLKYAKDLASPINHIQLIATAGVTPDNIKEFIDLGYIGAGISSYLADKKLIENEKFDTITERAKKLCKLIDVN